MKQMIAMLLAAAQVLAAGCAPAGQAQGETSAASVQTLAAAAYPEMATYPDETAYFDEKTGEFDSEGFSAAYDAWWDARRAQMNQPAGYADGLEPFFAGSIRQFLSGAGADNRVCSPLNVYMALGMLAELTGGESRAQILGLLGADSVEALRAQAKAVWNANYCDDGATATVLAGSLWLNQNVSFHQSALDTLADVYHASSFRGEMGTAECNRALQDWLNDQTGGLLEEQAGGVELDADTILALATTVYFRAKWSNEFSERQTAEQPFHSPDGDVSCGFMHQSGSRTYFWGEKFSAVSQPLENAGEMWFLLPDEGVSVEELLADDQAMAFLLARGEWADSKALTVNLSVPKFDVASDVSLIDGLKALGVTDVFDSAVSDFSPMTADTDEIYVSQAAHAARVAIDEEGCTAAAYTVMAAAGSGMPPEEEVDFVLDRPFVFAVTSRDGLPLFAGVVNRPA